MRYYELFESHDLDKRAAFYNVRTKKLLTGDDHGIIIHDNWKKFDLPNRPSDKIEDYMNEVSWPEILNKVFDNDWVRIVSNEGVGFSTNGIEWSFQGSESNTKEALKRFARDILRSEGTVYVDRDYDPTGAFGKEFDLPKDRAKFIDFMRT